MVILCVTRVYGNVVDLARMNRIPDGEWNANEEALGVILVF